jgi:hypothetical protein
MERKYQFCSCGQLLTTDKLSMGLIKRIGGINYDDIPD